MHPVEIQKLEGKTRAVIDNYLALPFGTKPNCPYFNNRRAKKRGGLRVLKGKGAPEEICEEGEIVAKLSRVNIQELSTDKLKEFLVEHDLGVDCSGFAYHVLNSLSQEKTGKPVQAFVRSNRTGFIGKIIAKFRPAENLGVGSFRNDANSKDVSVKETQPGDVITFIGTGKDKTYNHILVITGIEKADDYIRISYAHSYAWPSHGLYGHGVSEGDILIQNNEDLIHGTWKEKSVTGEDNYTFISARQAKELSLRRLNFLS